MFSCAQSSVCCTDLRNIARGRLTDNYSLACGLRFFSTLHLCSYERIGDKGKTRENANSEREQSTGASNLKKGETTKFHNRAEWGEEVKKQRSGKWMQE